jgi:hypothetical protein
VVLEVAVSEVVDSLEVVLEAEVASQEAAQVEVGNFNINISI